MLRGSRPGERRGGRGRGTPNRRTILRDRILSIGLEHPTASRRAFLFKLVKDRKLPADTRMAVAPKCFPAKRTRSPLKRRPRASAGTGAQEAVAQAGSALASEDWQTLVLVRAGQDFSPQGLDALLGIVQDAAADSKMRRKAARKIAEFLLPKIPKKPKVLPDEYGFVVSPKLASTYRDIHLELRPLSLVNERTRKIPAIADKIKKLKARSDAILRRLQVPCPTRYGVEQAAKDLGQLMKFTELRDNDTTLSEGQLAEEAHVKVRFDVLAASPEMVARRRRKALADAEWRFKIGRATGDFYAPPLSRQEQHELEFLRRLFPEPEPKLKLSEIDFDSEENFDMLDGHPFRDELPAGDGNFYPPDSKLRPPNIRYVIFHGLEQPADVADVLAKTADGPPVSPVGPAPTTDPI